METLAQDVKYAVRTLSKSPGFTAVAVLTAALGIGACTAIFSIVHAVLLRPLPYADASRLVIVWGELRTRSVPDWPLSPPHFQDLRDQAAGFEAFAALTPAGRTPVGGDGSDPEQLLVAGATPNLFDLLGVRIPIGRNFVEAEGTPQPPPDSGAGGAARPPTPAAIILSDALWRTRYGGNAGIVGRFIDIGSGGGRGQIVGVLPPGFEILFPPRVNMFPTPDMWVAARIDFQNSSRNSAFLRVIGKLKPNVTIAQAETQVDAIAADIGRRFPISGGAGLHFHAVPMHDDLVREVRPAILTLMSAVLFVLLIACVNVANLLIVRAAARGRELTIRAAIGGSRWRLIRELLAESAMIAACGTAVGIALADAAIRGLVRFGPADVPRLGAIALDPTVLAFTAGTGFCTALLSGIAPALRASRPDLMDALRQSGVSHELRSGRLVRQTMVTVEVALSFVLLIGAGLMVRTFVALHQVDPGYDPNGVLTFIVPTTGARPEERADFMRRVRERLGALPGVESVTAASPLPLDGQIMTGRWGPEAAAADTSLYRQADARIVMPGYFETMKTRLIAGRTFTEGDNNADARVIVLDDRMAARAFSGQPAVGRRILARIRTPEPEVFQVIGVVAHERHASLAADGPDCMFFTDGLVGFGTAGRWAVRTAGDPARLAGPIRHAVAEISPTTALAEIQPMTDLVDRAMAPTRFAVALIGLFGAVAVLLAAIGLYGVLSTAVRQRTSEIGMRMVFGAPRRNIFALVIGEGLRLSAVGVAAGILLSFAMTRLMTALLVGVTPTDPLTFAAMIVVFFLVAILACGLPARRASRLEPIQAIRQE
jgi:predicted permease